MIMVLHRAELAPSRRLSRRDEPAQGEAHDVPTRENLDTGLKADIADPFNDGAWWYPHLAQLSAENA